MGNAERGENSGTFQHASVIVVGVLFLDSITIENFHLGLGISCQHFPSISIVCWRNTWTGIGPTCEHLSLLPSTSVMYLFLILRPTTAEAGQ